MLNGIKEFFKKRRIKKYSTTLTSSEEGSKSLRELNPEIDSLVRKLKFNEKINNEELNKIIQYYFNTPKIEHGVYTFNKSFTDGMCFCITSINTIYGKNNDIEDIILTMSDIVYNSSITINISVKNFQEIFNLLVIKPPNPPSDLPKQKVKT